MPTSTCLGSASGWRLVTDPTPARLRLIAQGFTLAPSIFVPFDPASRRVACCSGVDVDPDTLLTGAEAARAVFRSRQLIRRWVQLGHLSPHSYAADGAPRYRLGDVWAAEVATRRSPLSSRNPARLAAA